VYESTSSVQSSSYYFETRNNLKSSYTEILAPLLALKLSKLLIKITKRTFKALKKAKMNKNNYFRVFSKALYYRILYNNKLLAFEAILKLYIDSLVNLY